MPVSPKMDLNSEDGLELAAYDDYGSRGYEPRDDWRWYELHDHAYGWENKAAWGTWVEYVHSGNHGTLVKNPILYRADKRKTEKGRQNGIKAESNRKDMTVWNLDYRCAEGRFLMSPHGMAVFNTRYLSCSETMVNACIRGWKLHLSESNKWRAASLQPLTFSNHCSNAILSNASPGLTIRFLGVNIGVFWESQDLSNGANVASQLANFFLSAHL